MITRRGRPIYITRSMGTGLVMFGTVWYQSGSVWYQSGSVWS